MNHTSDKDLHTAGVDYTEEFMDYLQKSPVCFQAVSNLRDRFLQAGFQELDLYEPWEALAGGKYFTGTEASLYAFTLPADLSHIRRPFFRMIGAHTDSPCFRIKPQPMMLTDGYLRCNVEVYGGPIFSTWLDRPLSLAGRVTLSSSKVFEPRVEYIDFHRAVLIIPNLAIHMNREVNKGTELNPQIDMLPIGGLACSQEDPQADALKNALAGELSVPAEQILDYDLFTYPAEQPQRVGFAKELISASRLDDLCMVFSAAQAFVSTVPSTGVNVFCAFNHEETGSRSRQGAGSPALSYILEKMSLAIGMSREQFMDELMQSFMISADVAHAVHPNHPERHDPVLHTHLGQGPVIKLSSQQSYVTESPDYSVFEQVCRKAGVPVQKFTNKSDSRGGSTIGPVTAGYLPCRIMDMGIPILAMHSSRELMAAADYNYTVRAFQTYYSL